MAPKVWRIAINHIACRRPANHVPKIGTDKFPAAQLNRLADIVNLVGNLGDISLCEPFRFVVVRRIEPALAVEADDAIEAGAVEKQKIPRSEEPQVLTPVT